MEATYRRPPLVAERGFISPQVRIAMFAAFGKDGWVDERLRVAIGGDSRGCLLACSPALPQRGAERPLG